MPASAMRSFAGMPELWFLVSEHIRSPRLLGNMRLVSKMLADAMTPRLCETLHIRADGDEAGMERLYRGLEYGFLGHVRTLVVTRGEASAAALDIIRGLLLPGMGNLRRLKWRDMFISNNTLRVLSRTCPRLTSLHVWFPQFLDVYADPEFCLAGSGFSVVPHQELSEYVATVKQEMTVLWCNLPALPFALEELELFNISEDISWWCGQIASVLRKNARTLRKLSLSLCPEACSRLAETPDVDSFHNFFGKLVRLNASAPRLRLRSLHLGHGVWPRSVGEVTVFTDLWYLLHVYIDNEDSLSFNNQCLFDLYPADNFNPSVPGTMHVSFIAYEAFGHRYCPNLRSFYVATYREDVRDVFVLAARENPAWTKQLAFWVNSHEHLDPSELMYGGRFLDLEGVDDPDGSKAQALEIGIARNVSARRLLQLDRGPRYGYDSIDGSNWYKMPPLRRPLHFRMTCVYLNRSVEWDSLIAGQCICPRSVLLDEVLGGLVQGDNGTIEGLYAVAPALPENERTAGSPDVQIDCMRELAMAVGLLKGLRYLSVNYANALGSMTQEQEGQIAHDLVIAAPGLCFIRVGSSCWRVFRDANGRPYYDSLDMWESFEYEIVDHIRH